MTKRSNAIGAMLLTKQSQASQPKTVARCGHAANVEAVAECNHAGEHMVTKWRHAGKPSSKGKVIAIARHLQIRQRTGRNAYAPLECYFQRW